MATKIKPDVKVPVPTVPRSDELADIDRAISEAIDHLRGIAWRLDRLGPLEDDAEPLVTSAEAWALESWARSLAHELEDGRDCVARIRRDLPGVAPFWEYGEARSPGTADNYGETA